MIKMKKIIVLFIVCLFFIVLGMEINALGCCVQEGGDGVMKYCQPSEGGSCSGEYDTGRCSNRAECTIGCCFVKEEGTFKSGISQIECVDYLNGIFDGTNPDCSSTEGYELGCCNIPEQCENGVTQGGCFEKGGEFISGLCSNEICKCDSGTNKICFENK